MTVAPAQTLERAAIAAQLRVALLDTPGLILAELIGSGAAETMHESSDIDVLLVTDAQDEDELYLWARRQGGTRRTGGVLGTLYALEQDLGRELHITTFTEARFLAEAARPSGFLIDVYLRPHVALASSLEEVLPKKTLAVLKTRALSFLERLEREGALSDVHRDALARLRQVDSCPVS